MPAATRISTAGLFRAPKAALAFTLLSANIGTRRFVELGAGVPRQSCLTTDSGRFHPPDTHNKHTRTVATVPTSAAADPSKVGRRSGNATSTEETHTPHKTTTHGGPPRGKNTSETRRRAPTEFGWTFLGCLRHRRRLRVVCCCVLVFFLLAGWLLNRRAALLFFTQTLRNKRGLKNRATSHSGEVVPLRGPPTAVAAAAASSMKRKRHRDRNRK